MRQSETPTFGWLYGRVAVGIVGLSFVCVLPVMVACEPAAQTVVPARTATAEVQQPAGAPSVAAFVPVDATQLRNATAAAAAAAGAQPTPPQAGPAISPPQAGKRRIGSWRELRDRSRFKGEPVLVDYSAVFFAHAPWATLSPEGKLTLRWDTRTNSPAASLYAGIRVEEDLVVAPRYRAYAVEQRRRAGRKHEATRDLRNLVVQRYDVNGILTRAYGEVAWQVEQYQPSIGSTVLHDGRTAFRLEPDGEGVRFVQQPTVVLGPLVHQLGETSFVVSFETDVPVSAGVGVGGRLPQLSSTPARRHEVLIEGLEAGREYEYQVAVSDSVETSLAPPRRLHTTDPRATVRVAIMSDSRSGIGPGREANNGVNAHVVSRLFEHAYRQGAQAVFFPGDLIDGYSTHPDDFDYQLRVWLQAVEGVHGTIPVYTGIGNHDVLIDQWSDNVALGTSGPASGEARFAKMMVNPVGAPDPERPGAPTYSEAVYSADLGEVHFVMLNTNYWYASRLGDARYQGRGNREGFLMDKQLAWLERDLEQARERGAQHIVVMGHEPAFPAGGHAKDGMWWNGQIPEVNAMRERFWNMLAHHGVLAFVSGDEHNYSRALIGPETVSGAERSVYSVISGGCGAPYYSKAVPEAYADQLEIFSAQQHYTLWTFEPGKTPRLQVFGLSGALIDDVELGGAGLPSKGSREASKAVSK